MRTSKYGSLLTILLIVLIVIVLIGTGLIVYNYVIKPKIDNKKKIEAIEEFDRTIEANNQEEDNNNNEDNGEGGNNEFNIEGPGDIGNNNKTTNVKKAYFKGFAMLGYITISKTSVKEPILDEVTPETLNTAVAVL